MTTKKESKFADIFSDLHSLESEVFPKTCTKCGRSYASVADFIEKTEDLNESSGLQDYDLGKTIVALFRNCLCESTLMVSCEDRRDMSEAGQKRRELFEQLLNTLIQTGVNPTTAREELLKVIRGEKSEFLESLDIKIPDLG